MSDRLHTGNGDTKPFRICHLGKYYPPSLGGIESHTQTLAQAQGALGASVQVVVVNHQTTDGRDATFERFTQTPTVDEWDGPVQVIRVGRWANIANLEIAPRLGRVLAELASNPPDIWHLHTPNVTMMLALLTLPQIRPLVITHHSDIIRQRILRHVVRPLEKAIYQRSARVLATSPAYIQGSELLKTFSAKVRTLPLGIDLGPFRSPNASALAFAKQYRNQFGSPLWLCIGRLTYYKGLHIALEALQTVSGRLLVIGTGPLEAELKRRTTEIGVADRVIWHGPATHDQLVGAYHAATALWFPSVARSEGFGLVQVEAMAAGCPVINTAIPDSGVAWVCRDGREGLTVNVADATGLANAASRLITESGLRDRLSTNAQDRAADFDCMKMGKQSIQLYDLTAHNCMQLMKA